VEDKKTLKQMVTDMTRVAQKTGGRKIKSKGQINIAQRDSFV
jgi:hypothetical protein